MIAPLCRLLFVSTVCIGLIVSPGIGDGPTRALAADDGAPPLGPLPPGVSPTHYDLDLTVIPDRDRFAGRVAIDVTVTAATDRIWLHGLGIHVKSAFVVDPSGSRTTARYEEVDKTGVARLSTDNPVGPGTLKLVIEYDAPFDRSLQGLYRVDGKTTPSAFTQFEPLLARRAFPGFDEPRFKTPFDISLTVKDEHVAVSNAPEESAVALGNGLKRIRFKTTKPLPTYLLAVAVGDFDVVEWPPIPVSAVRGRTIPLRGIAVRGKGRHFRYALENTAALLLLLESYFGIAYPFEKLDLIAAPDFASSGMENAGAIIYRESLILVDDQPSNYQTRELAYVHAHELAHHWFGNLVTPKWWDDLWLNEAFATWMGERVLHAWRPDEFDDRAAVRTAQRAMRSDSLTSARQIRQPIDTTHDIQNAFDRITYSKGAAILAMFERFIGAENFRTAIRHFMERFAYGSASADDFIRSLSERAGDARIASAFRSFLEQPGVPLLETRWSCGTEGRTDVAIKQSRYFPVGSKGSMDHRWQIPICIAYEEGGHRKQHCALVTEIAQRVALPTQQCPRWVMPNADGAGYYHWTASDAAQNRTAGSVSHLNDSEMLSLMGSLSAALRAGLTDTESYIEAARAAARSPSWDILESPMRELRNIKLFLLPDALKPKAAAVYRELYAPASARLALTPEALAVEAKTSNEALLRGDLIWFLANDAEDAPLRQRLSQLGQAYIGYGADGQVHPESLHPDLVRAALIVATHELGTPFFDALVAQMDKSTDAAFRSNLIAVLAFQSEPALAEKVRALFLTGSLTKREASRLLYRHARRVENREAIWDWMTAHFTEIVDRLPRSSRKSLPWLGGNFCSLEKRDTVRRFFEQRIASFEGGPRMLANVLENIELCAAVVAHHRSDVVAYFGRQ